VGEHRSVKWIMMKLYELELLQTLEPQDRVAITHFAEGIQNSFIERLIFSDEATFSLSEKVN
jgi:hypothetical protein